MTIDRSAVEAVLSCRHLAVVGASDEKANFGRTVVSELAGRGYEVIAIHPTATSVAGRPCYPNLAAAPRPLEAAIVMVGKAAAAGVVNECASNGIDLVWLFKGVGPGAVSPEALAAARAAGLTAVEGACPLMFLPDTAWIHRAHRRLRRLPALTVTRPPSASPSATPTPG